MTQLIIKAGEFTFGGHLEEEAAPQTCAAFKAQLPYKGQLVHVRWSGEGVWIPLGDILYPGGISETEILLAYGGVDFSSKMGQLAGNHFITLTSGLENLMTLGNAILWKGAHDIHFELA